mgnify:CR=1 FL=1
MTNMGSVHVICILPLFFYGKRNIVLYTKLKIPKNVKN